MGGAELASHVVEVGAEGTEFVVGGNLNGLAEVAEGDAVDASTEGAEGPHDLAVEEDENNDAASESSGKEQDDEEGGLGGGGSEGGGDGGV